MESHKMARVKANTKAKQKPVQRAYVSPNKPKAKAAEPVKPVERPIPETKTELLAEIGLVFDAVNRKMEDRQWETHFSHFGTFRDEGMRVEKLVEALNEVLATEGGDPEQNLADIAICEAFGAAPGTVPTWAQPGEFLAWIDYVPCLCVWGGFAEPDLEIGAIDPDQLWITPGGTINPGRRAVPSSCKTPEELTRRILWDSTQARSFTNGRKPTVPLFNLHRLEAWVKDELRAGLARPENAWLVAALRRGPANPIPLPAHLQAVQMPLWA
jgi:hypothetical protein